MSPAEVAEWTTRSRAQQGLEPTISDPAVLGRLITLAFAGQEQQGSGEGRAP